MVALVKSSLAGAAAFALFLTPALNAQTRIQGAGATFPAPLYAKWVDAYHKLHPEITIDYQAIGSGGGIKAITDRTAQFGASDAPLSADQEKAASNQLLHLPTVAGPEVMIFNLPGVSTLKINGEVITGIYLKKIRTWNDPAIAALNPGVTLPAAPIVVVHRSDGSGTTYIFTDYLSKVSPDWNDRVGKGTAVEWPAGIGAQGNDGVAANVKNTPGAIGYVEYAYAKKNKLSFAQQINLAGKEVAPTIDAINAAAAASLKSFPKDMKVSIVNAPGDDSYPICGYTYLLVYQDMRSAPDKETAEQTVQFIRWCETDGQEMAAELGYARLPKEAQQKVLEKLDTLTYKGDALGK
jgi:phosphate transport system substrate-binding protein